MPADAPGAVGKFFAWMGNDSYEVDIAEAEEKIRKEYPILQDDEHLVFAFKDGRDKTFLTDKRIIIRDKQGISGKRVQHDSIPYSSIRAFSIESAGSMDNDTELHVWTEMAGFPHIKIDFLKGHADIFAVQRLLSAKVLGVHQAYETPTNAFSGAGDSALSWLGDDMSQTDPQQVEAHLRASYPILLNGEHIEFSLKCGRDSVFFTTGRMIIVDVQGMFGKKVEWKTVMYSSFRAFAIQTAGGMFDADGELFIWTSMPNMYEIQQDLRKGKVDIFALQQLLATKLMGADNGPPKIMPNVASGRTGGGISGLMGLFGDDAQAVDTSMVESQLRNSPPILQRDEAVELAFKCGRDLMVFTTKRLLTVDVQGFTGKKVAYLTVPYSSILAFSVETAGTFDTDSELRCWTGIHPPPPPPPDSDAPPDPGMSYLTHDLLKGKADVFLIQKLLSARVFGASAGIPLHLHSGSPGGGGMGGFMAWLGNDASQLDSAATDRQLHQDPPILNDDERVEMAMKVGRDMACFTNKRILLVDVKGFSGKKVEYSSIAYHSIRGFSVESAGAWDTDAQFNLWTNMHWVPMRHITQDMRKGKTDVIGLQRLLAARVLPTQASVSQVLSGASSSFSPGAFLDWLGDDTRMIDAQAVNQQLHSVPPILLDDEQAAMAFKVGRDMVIFTQMRILVIDVQGWSGKKVEYQSYPLTFAMAFSVKSAGTFDRDSEMAVYLDMPGLAKIAQDVKQNTDLFAVQATLAKLMLPE